MSWRILKKIKKVMFIGLFSSGHTKVGFIHIIKLKNKLSLVIHPIAITQTPSRKPLSHFFNIATRTTIPKCSLCGVCASTSVIDLQHPTCCDTTAWSTRPLITTYYKFAQYPQNLVCYSVELYEWIVDFFYHNFIYFSWQTYV